MNQEVFCIPDETMTGQRILLSKCISAVQLVPREDGRGNGMMGLISQLGPGTVVEICGEGFSEHTAKIRSNGQYYFVFLCDVESMPAAAAAG